MATRRPFPDWLALVNDIMQEYYHHQVEDTPMETWRAHYDKGISASAAALLEGQPDIYETVKGVIR